MKRRVERFRVLKHLTPDQVAELSGLAVEESWVHLNAVGRAKCDLENADRGFHYYTRREKRNLKKKVKEAEGNRDAHKEAARLTFGPDGILTHMLIEAALVDDRKWEQDKLNYDAIRIRCASLYEDTVSLASETLELPEDANPYQSISSLYHSLQTIHKSTGAPYIRKAGSSMVVDGFSIGLYKPFTSTYKMDPPQFDLVPTRFIVTLGEKEEFARLGIRFIHNLGDMYYERTALWLRRDVERAHDAFYSGSKSWYYQTALYSTRTAHWYGHDLNEPDQSGQRDVLDKAAMQIAYYDTMNGFNDSRALDNTRTTVINGWPDGKRTDNIESRRARKTASTIPFGYIDFNIF